MYSEYIMDEALEIVRLELKDSLFFIIIPFLYLIPSLPLLPPIGMENSLWFIDDNKEKPDHFT